MKRGVKAREVYLLDAGLMQQTKFESIKSLCEFLKISYTHAYTSIRQGTPIKYIFRASFNEFTGKENFEIKLPDIFIPQAEMN